QMNCLKKHPEIDVLGTVTGLFTETKEIKRQSRLGDNWSRISKKQTLKKCSLSHSSVLIKKKYCFYDETRNSQLDYELWLRLSSQEKVLAKLNAELNYHRIHKNQSFES